MRSFLFSLALGFLIFGAPALAEDKGTTATDKAIEKTSSKGADSTATGSSTVKPNTTGTTVAEKSPPATPTPPATEKAGDPSTKAATTPITGATAPSNPTESTKKDPKAPEKPSK